jgi:hypothetical protein
VQSTETVENAVGWKVEMAWMQFPLTASRFAKLVVSKHKLTERASTEEVAIIGVDLAKVDLANILL